jgi:hypothetical protein
MARSRISDTVWTLFTETIRFIVVPLVLIDLVKSNWPQLSTAFLGDIVPLTLGFGALIVAASTLEVANKPGTFKRMFFGISTLAFLALWLFVVFGGGIASFTYYPYNFTFDMSKIVYIMLIGISLKALLIYRTYTDNKHLIAIEKKAATPRRTAARRTASSEFGSLSRVAYQVTSDDDVGYSSARPPIDSPASEARGKCPVCGNEVGPGDRSCPYCGAWL